MSKHDYKTTMGGTENVFHTTCWVDIRKAGASDEAQRKTIVDNLLKKYWKPVYCYLRHKGYDNERAKDLTQGFFHEIVLGHELIQKADQAKGRFRTFLLTALGHYVSNVYRSESAKKRAPKEKVVYFDEFKESDKLNISTAATAEDVFHYAWASNLLALPLSIVWTGELAAKCGGADFTGTNGRVDYKDFAVLASQWQQAPGVPSADIAPYPVDGVVNLKDLAAFAEHWLDENCN